jgi:arylsulfatase
MVRKKKSAIRARKNTKMVEKEGALILTFTGEDPGIAMDIREMKSLPPGPYVVAFDLKTAISGTGEIFYTTDAKTVLPNGSRIEFPVGGDQTEQAVVVKLSTDKRLQQIRIDVAEGKGTATIKGLRLLDASGEILKAWTSPAGKE